MATDAERIASLRLALAECADDLEAEIVARYGATKDHPAVRRRYERDMSTVWNAKNLLRTIGSNA